jgi:ABC-type phosphate transport system substrate-binding protein
MALTSDQLNADGLVQSPSVIGGTVAIVNLEGITSGEITLDAATLAKIFLGEIKTWNDPAIVKLNPAATHSASSFETGATLPDCRSAASRTDCARPPVVGSRRQDAARTRS